MTKTIKDFCLQINKILNKVCPRCNFSVPKKKDKCVNCGYKPPSGVQFTTMDELGKILERRRKQ